MQKKSFNFYMDQKNFRPEKNFFGRKAKKKFFYQNFFFDVKFFLVRNFFLT